MHSGVLLLSCPAVYTVVEISLSFTSCNIKAILTHECVNNHNPVTSLFYYYTVVLVLLSWVLLPPLHKWSEAYKLVPAVKSTAALVLFSLQHKSNARFRWRRRTKPSALGSLFCCMPAATHRSPESYAVTCWYCSYCIFKSPTSTPASTCWLGVYVLQGRELAGVQTENCPSLKNGYIGGGMWFQAQTWNTVQ